MGPFLSLLTIVMGWNAGSPPQDMDQDGLIYRKDQIERLMRSVPNEMRPSDAESVTGSNSLTYRMADCYFTTVHRDDFGDFVKRLKRGLPLEALPATDSDEDPLWVFEGVPIILDHSTTSKPIWVDPLHGEEVAIFKGKQIGFSTTTFRQDYISADKVGIFVYDFYEDKKAMPLPRKYGDMVDETISLLGTEPLFRHESWPPRGYGSQIPEELVNLRSFLSYEPPGITQEELRFVKRKTSIKYSSDRLEWIHEVRSKHQKFKPLLKAAAEAAIAAGLVNCELEDLTSRYLSKDIAIEIMRNGMDSRLCYFLDGRLHTREFRIAQLAAETGNLNLFVLAHLNLINEALEPLSNTHESQPDRRTFFRELEIMGLNLKSLVPGLVLIQSFSAKDTNPIAPDRLGRSLAEANDKEVHLETLLDMMTDNELDPPNRLQAARAIMGFLVELKPDEAEFYLARLQSEPDHLPRYFLPAVAWFQIMPR